MIPQSSQTRNALLFAVVAVAAQAGCLLLLWLSTFGPNPFPELPLPMIVVFGAFASGPLETLARLLSQSAWRGALALAVLGNLAYLGLGYGIAYLAGAGGATATPQLAYLVAPATGLLLAAGFRALPGSLGEMLSAMTVFVAATVLANYTFDSFIPLGDFFLVNVGTFFFGVTFTQRDRVHRFGRRNVYLMIAAAAAANVLTALHLGSELRFVYVGFLAIVLSEAADTEIYARLLDRPWIARVASSNAVSAPLDTVLFTVLAFAGQPYATVSWMIQVIVTDIFVKYGSGMIAALQIARGRRGVAAGT